MDFEHALLTRNGRIWGRTRTGLWRTFGQHIECLRRGHRFLIAVGCRRLRFLSNWRSRISSRFNRSFGRGIWWVILSTGAIHRAESFSHGIFVTGRCIVVAVLRVGRHRWSSRPRRHWGACTTIHRSGGTCRASRWLGLPVGRHGIQKRFRGSNSGVNFHGHPQRKNDKLRLLVVSKASRNVQPRTHLHVANTSMSQAHSNFELVRP